MTEASSEPFRVCVCVARVCVRARDLLLLVQSDRKLKRKRVRSGGPFRVSKTRTRWAGIIDATGRRGKGGPSVAAG